MVLAHDRSIRQPKQTFVLGNQGRGSVAPYLGALYSGSQFYEVVFGGNSNEQGSARGEDTSAFRRMAPSVKGTDQAGDVAQDRNAAIHVGDHPDDLREIGEGASRALRRGNREVDSDTAQTAIANQGCHQLAAA